MARWVPASKLCSDYSVTRKRFYGWLSKAPPHVALRVGRTIRVNPEALEQWLTERSK